VLAAVPQLPRPADLWSLFKPRIVALLCLTGLAALFAAGGAPAGTVLAFAVAGGCVAAGAAAFNCYYDRALDRRMARTADRPLPSGRLAPRAALAVAVCALVFGSAVALLALPLPSVAYMWSGVASYVGLYTVALKRRHWLGVVLGGSAGSFPVLAGWTAVKPLTAEPIVLALVVFAWTPAHAWALAYVYRRDFVAAGVPTLPTVASPARVRRAVWVSVWATLAVAAVAVPLSSPVYGLTVAVGGAFLAVGYAQFYRRGTEPAAVRAFFTSNLFLAALFASWGAGGVVDVGGPWLRLGVLVGLPVAFVLLWARRPALRGVPGSTGDGVRFLAAKLTAWARDDDGSTPTAPETDRRLD
jgi:protoheme IX farnesyltransferase